MQILDTIQSEITEYIDGDTEISDGVRFSEYKLKKRIQLFKNRHYPTGKVTDDGDYEYWFDIIHPRVNAEVKNLDFDTKHILVFSKNPSADFAATYVANLELDNWMWEHGRADELNASVEDFSADGNLLFRKTADGYEPWDMMNTFLTNTAARTVDETDIIERFYMTQNDLRRKEGVFKNIDNVIENCGNKTFSKTEGGVEVAKSTPHYELYRRTGEVSEYDLFEAQGKEGGDKNKYVLAMIVVAGLQKGASKRHRYVLFAEELKGKMSDWFIEAHRGPYKGRWFREGMYELLFDHQTRYNEISNQIARGLDWASKVLFRHTDVTTLQNLRHALDNGDIIKSADIQQIAVRLQGFDQLVNDRNNVLSEADVIANSSEIVQGQSLPSNTPFRLGMLIDVNAGKLFVFLRQKLSIAYRRVFREFVLPELVKSLKGKDVFRITGSHHVVEQFYAMAVQSWYIANLAKIGPHTLEMADVLKAEKVEELKRTDPVLANTKEIWEGVLPRLSVTITGENYLVEEIETIQNLLQFEQDPARRAYLTDLIYAAKGIPTPPAVAQAAPPLAGNQGPVSLERESDSFNVTPEAEPDPVEA